MGRGRGTRAGSGEGLNRRVIRTSPDQFDRTEGASRLTLARRVFLVAGVLGLLAVLPASFLESAIGRAQPPRISHPEFFHGFLGVIASWQVAFLVIARDPGRFRPPMIPAVPEKLTYGFAAVVLTSIGRIPPAVLLTGLIDLILGALFVVAHLRTGPNREPQP